jgi:hypothetical protein
METGDVGGRFRYAATAKGESCEGFYFSLDSYSALSLFKIEPLTFSTAIVVLSPFPAPIT